MQRRHPRVLCSKSVSDSFEVTLTSTKNNYLPSSDDIQFFRKKLRDLHHVPEPRNSTQSCCNFKPARPLDDRTSSYKVSEESPNSLTKQSLSMNQVLPFPKSSKENYITRLRNTFRKFHSRAASRYSEQEDSGTTTVSHFKFNRCEICQRLYYSHLNDDGGEKICETCRLPCSSKTTFCNS